MATFQVLLLFVVGLGTLAAAVWQQSMHRRVRQWPVTDGLVESSTVEAGSDGDQPQVRYRYRVGGRDYCGDALYPGGMLIGGNRSWAERVLRDYPPGARVYVSYNPANPQQSTLAAPVPLWVMPFMWLFGIGCIAAAWIARAG